MAGVGVRWVLGLLEEAFDFLGAGFWTDEDGALCDDDDEVVYPEKADFLAGVVVVDDIAGGIEEAVGA